MKIQSIQQNYAGSLTNNEKRNNSKNISSKGGFGDKISKFFGEKYAQKLYNSNSIRTFSEKASRLPGSMTQHMSTAGSIITSSVYMYRTVNNKDLEADKRRTLAINQGFCMVIPAVCAYTVDTKLKDKVKQKEYKYAGKQNQILASGKLTEAKANALKAVKGSRLKAVRTLADLATFTLIYRYVTPVVITPVSNMIGDMINNKPKKPKFKIEQFNNAPQEQQELARA